MLARVAFLAIALAFPAAAESLPFARVGDVWRYWPGSIPASAPPELWQQASFDDSAWPNGPSGFSAGLAVPEATDIPYLPGAYASVYFRHAFTLESLAMVKWVTLRADYTDGFVAYLNGREIARRNLAGELGGLVPHDRLATNWHARGYPEEIDVTFATNLLRVGTNLLAVQVHAAGIGTGLAFSAELLPNFQRAPYLQNMSSNSVQIIWKTPVPTDTKVSYGKDGLGWSVWDTNLVTTHVATLNHLEPDTAYRYQVSSSVGGETASLPPAGFRTFKVKGPIRFVVFGDGGWNSVDQYKMAAVMRHAAPDFALEVGDNVYPLFLSSLADPRCFSVYQEHMAQTPYLFALGNHDLLAGVGQYLDTFYLPTNSVSLSVHAANLTSPEHYYSFDHGDAHFTVLFVPFLNQYRLSVGDPQYNWFTNDLAQTSKPWKVVFWHVPMNSSSAHRGDDINLNGIADRLEVREVILPVLAQHGVQLVVCGHEHGYERFTPTNGVHFITTAGGGGPLYGFTESDFSSQFYWARFNALQVNIEEDRLEALALGTDGSAFDRMVIQRALPAPKVYQGAWAPPLPDPLQAEPSALFPGEPIPALAGQFSNLGRAFVSSDAARLYIGLDQAMIHGDNNIFLFVESPRLAGVTNLFQIGNGAIDPEGQGVDGLDFLANLTFTNFAPSIGCVLGDIHANAQSRSFLRTNLAFNLGQGVFRLDRTLTDVAGVTLRQYRPFEASPAVLSRDNAQSIALSIPLAELGGVRSGDTIRVGAVVGGSQWDTNRETRLLDSGFLGRHLAPEGDLRRLEGVEVKLALDPDGDQDGDGLTLRQELALGTNPDEADSDGDGLPDGWEVANRLDPLSAVGAEGAAGDPDEDGMANQREWLAGTDPRDARSSLRLHFEMPNSRTLRLSWLGVPGLRYQLQSSDASAGPFVDGTEAIFSAGQVPAELSHTMDIESIRPGGRFFRVRIAR